MDEFSRWLFSTLNQAVNPLSVDARGRKWTERGVPGFLRGLVEDAQRHPVRTALDFTPVVGDVKAVGYDAPQAFSEGQTGLGMLALASALPGVPNLAKNLPMDEASRMARAREMGFDVDTPLYHGTNRTFDEFDMGRVGEGAGSDAERAIFATDNPDVAAHYSDIISADEGHPQVMALMARGNIKDVHLPAYRSFWVEDALDTARKEGYDGVRFVGMQDAGAWGEGANQVAIFDPKNIRSRWAAFDPAQSESANLLAGGAGLLLLSRALQAQNREHDAQRGRQ